MHIPTPHALTLEVDAIRAAQIDAECDNIIRVIRSRWPSPVKDCRLLSPPPSEMFAEIIRRFAAKGWRVEFCYSLGTVTVEQAAPEPLPQSPEADIITGPGMRLATRGTIRRDVRAYLLERNWAPEALDAIGL